MPRAVFMAQLGVFVLPRFLDAGQCASLRHEIQASPSEPAQILSDEFQSTVDRNTRRTEIALVPSETRAWVTSRLMAMKPSLEKHFQLELNCCESPSFLVYKKGFYFSRHVDSNPFQDAPIKFRDRRVSVSIFLNGEGGEDDPDAYGGGSLTFHGSRRDQGLTRHPGLAVTGEEGLLIAFPSHWPHEVTAVHHGTRYSIVTWFA